MRSVVAVLLAVGVVGCSQAPVAKRDVRSVDGPVRLSREQVQRNREALAMTAAYRSRTGIATETTRPHDPSDADPLTRMRLAKTNPEYGTTGPIIQGVDVVTAAPKDPK